MSAIHETHYLLEIRNVTHKQYISMLSRIIVDKIEIWKLPDSKNSRLVYQY